MRVFIKNFIYIHCLIFVLTTSGCTGLFIGAAAGAGGAYYIQGKLEQNFDYTVKEVHAASLAVCKDLGIFVTSDELNRHSAKIKGETEAGKKIYINVEALTERASKIAVRIGVFGNRQESQEILDAVWEKL